MDENYLLPPRTDEEDREFFDRAAWRYLHMSGDEFIERYDAGEYDEDPDRHPIMMMILLLPMVNHAFRHLGPKEHSAQYQPETPRKTYVAAAGLIRRGQEILLVHQQGPDNPNPNWALPGGVVESGELVCDTLVREIREETGLTVNPPFRLLYVAQQEGVNESQLAFIYEIEHWSGELVCDDPDDLILEPRWMSENDAITRLELLPWRVMREPILSYLRNATEVGASWFYRSNEDGETSLIARYGST